MPEESTPGKASKTGSSRRSTKGNAGTKTKAAKATTSSTASQPEEKQSILLATGLEDYGRWKAMFRNHKPKDKKPFRRGRIWA